MFTTVICALLICLFFHLVCFIIILGHIIPLYHFVILWSLMLTVDVFCFAVIGEGSSEGIA